MRQPTYKFYIQSYRLQNVLRISISEAYSFTCQSSFSQTGFRVDPDNIFWIGFWDESQLPFKGKLALHLDKLDANLFRFFLCLF